MGRGGEKREEGEWIASSLFNFCLQLGLEFVLKSLILFTFWGFTPRSPSGALSLDPAGVLLSPDPLRVFIRGE